MEVATGIYRIETSFGERINAVYYLWGAERSLLVDAGTRQSAPEILAAITMLGAPLPSYVVSTHCDWDHVAGNGVVRAAAPSATFIAHAEDRAQIESVDRLIDERYGEFAADHGFDETDESKAAVRDGTSQTAVDIAVTGGETIRLGPDWTVTVLHTPGHSPGSISVSDPRSGALVIGDAVLGAAVPFATGAPAFPPTYRHVDDYLATIDAISKLSPHLLLTSHYPLYQGSDVTAFLDESREFAQRAEAALAQAVGAWDDLGLLEIAQEISSDLGSWPTQAAPALLYPLSGHAERLVTAGRITASRSVDGRVRYRRAER